MDLVFSICIGSAIQVALVVAPLLVLLSWAIGHPMNLVCGNQIDLFAIAGTAIVVRAIAADGENALISTGADYNLTEKENRAMQDQKPAATTAPAAKRTPKVVVQTADVRIVEYTLQPGDSHPWHYHTQVSDRIYCLEGQIGVDVQTPPQRVVLQPGENCEVPPKSVHHVSNAGDNISRYLLVQALGKYDYIRTD